MKNLMGAMEGGSIPALNNIEESLKVDQKVPYFLSSFPYLCSTITTSQSFFSNFYSFKSLPALGSSWYCKAEATI